MQNRKAKTAEQQEQINKIILLQNKVFSRRKSACPFSQKDAPEISYKNIELLEKYISERGKIMPSRMAGISYKQQRKLSNAIKRGRILALLPFVRNNA